jgi:photosystem II stability/assembly factor-like uncharacterized protein
MALPRFRKLKLYCLFALHLTALGCINPYPSSLELEQKSGDSQLYNWKKINGRDLITVIKFKLSDEKGNGWGIDDDNNLIQIQNGITVPYRSVLNKNKIFLSLWLSKDGRRGFAVGEKGLIAKLTNNTWQEDRSLGFQIKNNLENIDFSDDLSVGYITGENGLILKYVNGNWTRYPVDSLTKKQNLTHLSLSSDGRHGFIMDSNNSLQMFLINDRWIIDKKFKQTTADYLESFSFNDDYTEGWAAGTHGGVYHYSTVGQWEKKFQSYTMRKILMNRSLTEGWGVGLQGQVIHYSAGRWTTDDGPTHENLYDLWMNDNFNKGWCTGNEGIISTYTPRLGWTLLTDSNKIISSQVILDQWLNDKFSDGWAVGSNGRIYHFNGKSWKYDTISSKVCDNWLFKIAMNKEGTEGWAIGGYGRILHYKDGKWNNDTIHYEDIDVGLRAIRMNTDFKQGFIVGESGILLKLGLDQIWHVTQKPIEGSIDFTDIWLSQDMQFGWITGSNGMLYNLINGQIVENEQASNLTNSDLLVIKMDADGRKGFIFGDNGTILSYNERWEQFKTSGMITNEMLNAAWISPDFKSGWIVGESGTTLMYKNQTFQKVNTDSIVRSGLNGVCLDASQKIGYTVGEGETILRLDATAIKEPIITYEKNEQLAKLKGIFRINFSAPLNNLPKVDLLDSKGRNRITDDMYTVSFDHLDSSKVLLKFKYPADILQDFSNELCTIMIDCSYRNQILNQPATYESTTFYTVGPPFWYKTLLAFIGIIIFNTVLILLAIPYRFFRRIMLHPVGSALAGLVVGKYLFTDFLIRFVVPVKLALFRGYRKKILEAPFITELEGMRYIPQKIVVANGEEVDYIIALQKILSNPKGQLWVLVGRSGLGKTLLTKHWTKVSIGLRQTPILIRLGSELTAEEETKGMFEQLGDIDLKEDGAMDLIKSGGFLIILDGYNEDSLRARTKEFVRSACISNTVIMTSQTDPIWEDKLIVKNYIILRPFKREQLEAIIPKKWIDTIYSKPYLKDFAELPQTATLLSIFIKGTNKLPAFKIDVYNYLIRDLINESQTVQLEKKTWELFINFSVIIINQDSFTDEYIQKAILSGVLTRQGENFTFTHELVMKYFLARYMFKRDKSDFINLHREFLENIEKSYWSDAIELLGELYANFGKPDPETRYFQFLRDALCFSITIFQERLYPQLKNLYIIGVFKENIGFQSWMADYLATHTD